MTITLPVELEAAIAEAAHRQGTTPELLALDGLRKQFLPATLPASTDGTLADFLGDFIGSIDSTEYVPGGAQMSVDTGRRFAAGMVKKRKNGRL